MAEAKQEGNIVEEYKIGNTTVLISDAAYRNRTPEEIERILQRVTAIGWEIVDIARAEGKEI